jgi:hypothetical protein
MAATSSQNQDEDGGAPSSVEEMSLAMMSRMMDSSQRPISSDDLGLAPALCGLQQTPFLPLAEAVAPLESLCAEVTRIARACVKEAKQRLRSPGLRNTPFAQLTVDEAGALLLYTEQFEPVPLYTVVNRILREGHDAQQQQPLRPYLKLLLSGLRKLPTQQGKLLYRGIRPVQGEDLFKLYNERRERGLTVSWWGFTSTTRRRQTLESRLFCGAPGPRVEFTLVGCSCGVDIQPLSRFGNEHEVLLPPGVEFEVEDVARGALGDSQLVQITLRMVDDGRGRVGEVV